MKEQRHQECNVLYLEVDIDQVQIIQRGEELEPELFTETNESEEDGGQSREKRDKDEHRKR